VKIYGKKMVQERYTPGFALPLALKDVRLALSEADAADCMSRLRCLGMAQP